MTSPSEPLGRETASELRHELRTPVNHILGYAEMLREDAADGSPDAARIDRIVATAREVLARINAALPPTGVATLDDLDALIHDLRMPQTTVLDEVTALSASVRDAQYAADLDRIAQAARRLTAVPVPGAKSAAPAESLFLPG